MSKKMMVVPHYWEENQTRLQPFKEWIREKIFDRENKIEDNLERVADYLAFLTEFLCDKGVVTHEEVAKQLDWKPPEIVDDPNE